MSAMVLERDINSELNVYGYARLSRDDDKEQISLTNQKGIILDFAKKKGYNIIDIFEDDNISGMTFDRDGINHLKKVIDKGNVDILLVKDLSRLGRHMAHSALFMEYAKAADVNIISITEGVDNFNENDELVIGFKQIINEQYAKDISRKIKTGFKQKQKEGLVIVPPFGYVKNKVTDEVEIYEETADIVRLIFELYISGNGIRKVAQILTEKGIKRPSWYHKQLMNKSYSQNKLISENNVWNESSISRILKNESYIGTLRCRQTVKSMGKRKKIAKDEQYIHEDFFPPIIDNVTWNTVQAIFENRTKNNVRASSTRRVHRYAGLLECKDCGSTFTAKRRKWKDNDEYIQYVCNGYHRYGRKVCTSHTINESELDEILTEYLKTLEDVAKDNLENIDEFIKEWNYKKRDYSKSIDKIQFKVLELKEDIKEYAKQNARGTLRDDIYEELTQEVYQKMDVLEKQVSTLKEVKEINNNAKLGIQNSVKMLKNILKRKKITNAQIQLMVNKIYITELDITLNMPFKHHLTLSSLFTEPTVS